MPIVNKCIFFLMSFFTLLACSTSGHLVSDSAEGEGSSFHTAIVVQSVDEEYEWLAKHYPGYKLYLQALQKHKGKHFDVMKIKTIEGVNKSIYFDISAFFGMY